MESPAALSLVASFTLILDGLLKAIAAKIQDYPFNDVMVVYLWKRVNRVKNRFLALVAKVQSGKIPRERAARPRARKPPTTNKPPGINWRFWLPMSRFAWLCRMMPCLPNRFGAAPFAGGLRNLLHTPEMQAVLAATPKAARLLAPLCFMLGIEACLLRTAMPDAAAPTPAPAMAAAAPEAAPRDPSRAARPGEDAPPRAPDRFPRPYIEIFYSG